MRVVHEQQDDKRVKLKTVSFGDAVLIPGEPDRPRIVITNPADATGGPIMVATVDLMTGSFGRYSGEMLVDVLSASVTWKYRYP